MASATAPILSTPAEHIFHDDSHPQPLQVDRERLSHEQLYIQYEVQRTIDEIRRGRWKRIALQFPDDMLVDAPRVFEALRHGLQPRNQSPAEPANSTAATSEDITAQLQKTPPVELDSLTIHSDVEVKLTVLADTSYGACCVDEVAAEHIDADVVVHYGRSCLSPTARLPVIYIFTEKSLDLDAAVESFCSIYTAKESKVCLMADIPYDHHLENLHFRLIEKGYLSIFKTQIVHNPSSLIPNRSIPEEAQLNSLSLQEYSVFHLADPPTSLLLVLSSRIKSMHIFQIDVSTPAALEASTTQLLRRRYALLTRLSTTPIFGILINTLSVSNYMSALQHCQELIARAGKKSYVFVVGKVNPAKVANFSEIGGWVVIGCWESSLIESKDFYRPIITPFELEVALTDDRERVWGGQWVADFSALLGRNTADVPQVSQQGMDVHDSESVQVGGDWDEEPSDEEPPEFDLRTGQYVSRTRPLGRPKRRTAFDSSNGDNSPNSSQPSSALVQRVAGDVARIGGEISPAADFLRSKRTWQGLGSDFEVSYERNEDGTIAGAAMEEGRGGVAKGYEAEGTSKQP